MDECKPLNDGSFCREVFSHVVYHIIKAPDGAGAGAYTRSLQSST